MFLKENPDSKKNDGVSSPLSLSRRNGPFEFSVDIVSLEVPFCMEIEGLGKC